MIYTEENYRKAKSNDTFEFVCKHCGEVFTKTKREISRNRKPFVFCSNKCRLEWYNETCYIEVECKCCGKRFNIKKGDYNRNADKNFFCSHSCSAKYNNHKRTGKDEYYTKEPQYDICPICGNKKTIGSEMCIKCRNQRKREAIKENTLGKYINGKHYLGHAVSDIRKDARRTIIESGKEKVCAYCHNHDYDAILEVHHIKGILEFDEKAKVSEINDISNLEWLCPNHHRMLELGLIKLDG